MTTDPNRVWVSRLTHENARRAIDDALDRIAPSGGATVIAIKMNLCDYRRAESGAVTDPVILGALLEALRERHRGARRGDW